ncbi:MAG: molecular chaperone HtpG [Bacteroidota bacterium]
MEPTTPSVEAPQEHAFKAEMQQLLHLLIHSLYTHQDIFLRELISNASDALNKVRFRMLTDREVRDAEAALRIELTADPEAGTLTIEDTGIGMTATELTERLGTVASSGTLSFLQEMKQSGQPLDGEMIGKFGVGFYSAFMVAERVVVETCPADQNEPAHRWTSDGAGTYTVEPIDRQQRGTRITLHLREQAHEYAQEARIRHVIQKYSNFIDFPIALGGTQVNTVEALWRKPKGELVPEEVKAFYQFVAHDYQDPLGHLHVKVEGTTTFRALLFVPAQAPPGLFRDDFQRKLHLYAAGVFIQDNSDLLPEYLRFIRGVVDTEDLPLNVSREVTQESPSLRKISKILVNRVLSLLRDWAEAERSTAGSDEPDTRYATFFEQFGALFKLGINTDEGNREAILDLLRYESTHTEAGAYTSLQAYVDRMQEGQETIYYALGDHRTVLERTPNLEYFKKHNVEVLLLTDPVDVFTFPYLATYQEYPLQSIEKADLDLVSSDAVEEASTGGDQEALLARMKTVLEGRVQEVRPSKRLVDSAATLVVGSGGVDRHMERMMQMMNQGLPSAPKVLEVNLGHPLIRNLNHLVATPDQDATVVQAIEQLYAGALLLEGSLEDPASFVERMTAFMVSATTPDAPPA